MKQPKTDTLLSANIRLRWAWARFIVTLRREIPPFMKRPPLWLLVVLKIAVTAYIVYATIQTINQ